MYASFGVQAGLIRMNRTDSTKKRFEENLWGVDLRLPNNEIVNVIVKDAGILEAMKQAEWYYVTVCNGPSDIIAVAVYDYNTQDKVWSRLCG